MRLDGELHAKGRAQGTSSAPMLSAKRCVVCLACTRCSVVDCLPLIPYLSSSIIAVLLFYFLPVTLCWIMYLICLLLSSK